MGRNEKRISSTEADVIDVYARLSCAANGVTIKVDDQIDMGREAVSVVEPLWENCSGTTRCPRGNRR